MPQIVMTKLKGQDHDKAVKAKIMSFLAKLTEDDGTPGLNIERMEKAADRRARTGRVDLSLRAVLYLVEAEGQERTYVYAGTWQHDEAIDRARTRVLRINPVNGISEFIESSTPDTFKTTIQTEYVQVVAPEAKPYLREKGFLFSELTEQLGFEEAVANELYGATNEDQLSAIAARFENQWQELAVLGMAVGDNVAKIRLDLGFGEAAIEIAPGETEDSRLAKALLHPAARMQFAFIENNDELQSVIEGGDFGAWRVFLHPEQRTYVDKNYNGAFRLSGGAGTGKTVVLLHRARRLAVDAANPRVILTTFTKALSAALERDLERLDPNVPRASGLGDTGVFITGIDALAASVRARAGTDFWKAAATKVFGSAIDPRPKLEDKSEHWIDAIRDASVELPAALAHASFLDGEYLQVILPNRITSKESYLKVRRAGRGVALDRKKRGAVWAAIEQYRQNARHSGRMSYAEVSSFAAAYLEDVDGGLADYVLIDEAQDLTPLHWQLLRAVVPAGSNDLFIAEDTHQRIYGQHVVLARYGIKITGRSRRLTLNYRTTQQNLHYAMGVLEGGVYLDVEDAEESDHGYRSARRGPSPRPLAALTESEQLDNVAATVRAWCADPDVRPETVAILARTNPLVAKVKDQLAERGVQVAAVEASESASGRPLVMTMHKAKGMEFSRVLLFDISEGAIPPQWALRDVAEEELADAKLRERSLLYVAASRARDELVVSWAGKPSSLLIGGA